MNIFITLFKVIALIAIVLVCHFLIGGSLISTVLWVAGGVFVLNIDRFMSTKVVMGVLLVLGFGLPVAMLMH